MNDPATWYLVIEMTAAAAMPGRIIGPVTEKQCENVRHAVVLIEGVAAAHCRKAIGLTSCDRDGRHGSTVYACPLFDGDIAAGASK